MLRVRDKPVLTGPEVAHIASVPEYTIRNWRRAGHLRTPIYGKTGKRYSAQNALEVVLAAKLVELKIGIGFVPDIMSRLLSVKLASALIFVDDDGKHVVETDNPKSDMLQLFKSGVSVLVHLPVRSARRKIESACAAEWEANSQNAFAKRVA